MMDLLPYTVNWYIVGDHQTYCWALRILVIQSSKEMFFTGKGGCPFWGNSLDHHYSHTEGPRGQVVLLLLLIIISTSSIICTSSSSITNSHQDNKLVAATRTPVEPQSSWMSSCCSKAAHLATKGATLQVYT